MLVQEACIFASSRAITQCTKLFPGVQKIQHFLTILWIAPARTLSFLKWVVFKDFFLQIWFQLNPIQILTKLQTLASTISAKIKF